eukprot:10072943-Lingulodinium_polyedra.AAC.1
MVVGSVGGWGARNARGVMLISLMSSMNTTLRFALTTPQKPAYFYTTGAGKQQIDYVAIDRVSQQR